MKFLSKVLKESFFTNKTRNLMRTYRRREEKKRAKRK